jgi:hypothetical protein
VQQELRSTAERCERLEESLERATASTTVEQDARLKLALDEMAQLKKQLSTQANRLLEKEHAAVQLREQLAELKQQALVADRELDAARSRIADLESSLDSKAHELQVGELKVADHTKRLAADLARKDEQLKLLQASMKQLETRHAEQLALAFDAHRQESEAEMQALKHHLVMMEREVRLHCSSVAKAERTFGIWRDSNASGPVPDLSAQAWVQKEALEAEYSQQIDKFTAELRTATARHTAFELDLCAMQPAARQIEELLIHSVSAIERLDGLRCEMTHVFNEHGWAIPLDVQTTGSREHISERLASPASAATNYNLGASLVHVLTLAKRMEASVQSCAACYSQEIPSAVRAAIANAKDSFARQLVAATADGDQQHGRVQALEQQLVELNRLLRESRQDQIVVADKVDAVRKSLA